MFNSLWAHEWQHAEPPCPSPPPGVYSNSSPLSWWCHPTISSSVFPLSSCLQSFPASGSFPMSQFFASGGQSIGISASTSVLPMDTQDWSPLGWTGWISLLSKGFSRGGFRMGNMCTPVADTCWCMAKPIQYCKVKKIKKLKKIKLKKKKRERDFSNTTVQKHQFFGAQLS